MKAKLDLEVQFGGQGRPKGRPGGRQDVPKGVQGACRTAQREPKEYIWRSFGTNLEPKLHMLSILAEVRADSPCASEMEVRRALEQPKGRPRARQDGPKGAQVPKKRPEGRQDGPKGAQGAGRTAQRAPRGQAGRPKGRPGGQAGRSKGPFKALDP